MRQIPLRALGALLALALLILLAGPPPSAAQGLGRRVYLPLIMQPSADLQSPEERAMAEGVLALVNQQRAGAGCGPLRFDAALIQAAQAHSEDMAARGYFSHVSPEGTEFWQRANAAGYTGFAAAENIAAGQRSPEAVMGSWMGSTGHSANILNCGYNEIGVGYHSRTGSPWGTYWTQVFGVR